MSSSADHPTAAPPEAPLSPVDPAADESHDGQLKDPPASQFQRMHPLTPLFTGWKVFAGLIAVLSIQNIRALTEEFTITRLAWAGLILAALILVIVVLSAVSWAVTRYAVTESGVFVTKRLLSVSRRIAPRERIDSVSIHRPLLPRLLGLAKVRVELAGGGDSGVDIAYVSSARAEAIYREVLQLTNPPAEINGHVMGEHPDSGHGQPGSASEHAVPGAGPGGAPEPTAGRSGLRGRAEEFLFDHVTDGRLLAQIPTSRVLRAMTREISLWVGLAFSVLIAIAAVASLLLLDGFNLAAIVPALAALVVGPQLLLGRLESGWGFTSRSTDAGLRARRGLLNTRTDSISAQRLQEVTLERPFLWRGPGWTRITAVTAGAEAGDEASTNGKILPVGTDEEVDATLIRMLPPADLTLLHRMLTAPPASLNGRRPTSRLLTPIARRRSVTTLTDGFLLHRSGLIGTRLTVVPRQRIQGVTVSEDPLERHRSHLTLSIACAGDDGSTNITLTAADALSLAEVLQHDAAASRRYRDRENWARPAEDDPSDDEIPVIDADSDAALAVPATVSPMRTGTVEG